MRPPRIQPFIPAATGRAGQPFCHLPGLSGPGIWPAAGIRAWDSGPGAPGPDWPGLLYHWPASTGLIRLQAIWGSGPGPPKRPSTGRAGHRRAHLFGLLHRSGHRHRHRRAPGVRAPGGPERHRRPGVTGAIAWVPGTGFRGTPGRRFRAGPAPFGHGVGFATAGRGRAAHHPPTAAPATGRRAWVSVNTGQPFTAGRPPSATGRQRTGIGRPSAPFVSTPSGRASTTSPGGRPSVPGHQPSSAAAFRPAGPGTGTAATGRRPFRAPAPGHRRQRAFARHRHHRRPPGRAGRLTYAGPGAGSRFSGFI